MLLIMDDVKSIPKAGYNSFHKYKFVTEADVADVFSKSFRAHRVFMFSSVVDRTAAKYSTRGGKESFLVTVKIESTIVDADSGESFTVSSYGDGSDSDDKGIYKAITGAMKYLLMKTFLVSTGHDPERYTPSQPNKNPGGVKVFNSPTKMIPDQNLLSTMRRHAANGKTALNDAWKTLTPKERGSLAGYMDEFKGIIQETLNKAEKEKEEFWNT